MDHPHKWLRPALAVPRQQPFDPSAESVLFSLLVESNEQRLRLSELSQLDLQANELGPRFVAVLLEPVGVNEARGVVERMRSNRGPQCTLFVGWHRKIARGRVVVVRD
jgi:hypothetical protein